MLLYYPCTPRGGTYDHLRTHEQYPESGISSTQIPSMIQDSRALTYPVMEHFYTLQGEGAYVGHGSYFIRLGGCQVGCVWCDVKESWPIENHPLMTVEEILASASAHATRLAVITGGEPAMHDLGPLTKA